MLSMLHSTCGDMMPTSSPDTKKSAGAVTVRGLPPALKARLRVRAAHNARSMEAEARAILEAALSDPQEEMTDLASFARGLFAPLGGVELDLPPREPARAPPDFGALKAKARSAKPADGPRRR
jgi:plasmid stability protein